MIVIMNRDSTVTPQNVKIVTKSNTNVKSNNGKLIIESPQNAILTQNVIKYSTQNVRTFSTQNVRTFLTHNVVTQNVINHMVFRNHYHNSVTFTYT